MLIGVAAVWNDRKGLDDYIRLASILPEEYLGTVGKCTMSRKSC